MADPRNLVFTIHGRCSLTKARTATMLLTHASVATPVFMPVGTSGCMKGVTTQQLDDLGCQIILGNTYHLALQPGKDHLESVGGLHGFMGWGGAMLTDSGGFQMVSLLKFSEVSLSG